MDRDAGPYVPPPGNTDLELYKKTLLERFGNKAVSDQISRLCFDGVSKIPVYVMPVLTKMIRDGADLERLAFFVAAYRHYLKHGKDDRGQAYEVNEPWLTKEDRKLIASDDPLDFLALSPFRSTDLKAADKFVSQYLGMVEKLEKTACSPFWKIDSSVVIQFFMPSGPCSGRHEETFPVSSFFCIFTSHPPHGNTTAFTPGSLPCPDLHLFPCRVPVHRERPVPGAFAKRLPVGCRRLENTFITLIPFFFFLAYLVNGNIASRWINRYGYKTTLIRGLLFMVLGLAVFFLSAWFTVQFGDLRTTIAGASIPYGYFIFLAGSYAMGTSATVLQVVINPYVTSYELKGTQPVQRLNIVCAVNSFGTTIAPFS